MPPQADWLKTKVEEFRPEETVVVTADGSKVKYDYLIVAVGMKVDFERVREEGKKGESEGGREGGREGGQEGIWRGNGGIVSKMHIMISAIFEAEYR